MEAKHRRSVDEAARGSLCSGEVQGRLTTFQVRAIREGASDVMTKPLARLQCKCGGRPDGSPSAAWTQGLGI